MSKIQLRGGRHSVTWPVPWNLNWDSKTCRARRADTKPPTTFTHIHESCVHPHICNCHLLLGLRTGGKYTCTLRALGRTCVRSAQMPIVTCCKHSSA